MKLLEYPRFYNQGRKKSTELLEMDKMSNYMLSVTKPRERESDIDDDRFNFNDQSKRGNNNIFTSTELSQYNI